MRNSPLLESQRYPGQLQYTVVVRGHEGGEDRVEHYHSGYDAYTGSILFDPVSDEELAHPHYPKGMNIGIFLWRIGKAEPPADFLGAPDSRPITDSGIGTTPLTPVPQPFDARRNRTPGARTV